MYLCLCIFLDRNGCAPIVRVYLYFGGIVGCRAEQKNWVLISGPKTSLDPAGIDLDSIRLVLGTVLKFRTRL